MFAFRPLAVAVLLATLPFSTPARAFDDGQRKEIESVVRAYILSHPEVILEAVDSLREKNEAAAAENSKGAIAANREALTNDPASPIMGNPKGDITLVEFFDYNCGYCKSVQKDLMDLVKADGKIKFVFKDFPILAESSTTAAKAALAARAQGKYVEFHVALMAHRGALDTDAIFQTARDVGLDTTRLKTEMESPEIAAIIAKNHDLGGKLGVRGTPAFVLGDQLIGGALPKTELAKLIAAERGK